MRRFVDLSKSIAGLRGNRIHVLPQARADAIESALHQNGFEVCVVDGARAKGEAAFFDEVAHALKLPAYFGHNWDALNDAMSDLVETAPRRLAIVWRHADASLAADAQTVVAATLAFEAAAFEGFEASENDPLQIEVFLLGDAPGFR